VSVDLYALSTSHLPARLGGKLQSYSSTSYAGKAMDEPVAQASFMLKMPVRR
jgi:hypothetical protein